MNLVIADDKKSIVFCVKGPDMTAEKVWSVD